MRFLFICIFTIISCISCKNNTPPPSPPPFDYHHLSNIVSDETAKEIQEKYNVRVAGFGGSAMEDIRLKSLAFSMYVSEGIQIEQARKLLIEWVDIFLKHINQTKALRPYLFEYPFPSEAVEIKCFIYDQDGKLPSSNSLAVFSI